MTLMITWVSGLLTLLGYSPGLEARQEGVGSRAEVSWADLCLFKRIYLPGASPPDLEGKENARKAWKRGDNKGVNYRPPRKSLCDSTKVRNLVQSAESADMIAGVRVLLISETSLPMRIHNGWTTLKKKRTEVKGARNPGQWIWSRRACRQLSRVWN